MVMTVRSGSLNITAQSTDIDFPSPSRPVLLLLPQPCHGAPGQPGLFGILRVALDLMQGLMAADRRDLLGRASGMCQPHAGGLAQAVRGELLAGFRGPVEADGPTPLAEPFRKALLGERA